MLMLFTSRPGSEMSKQLMTTTATRPGDRAGDHDRQKTAARLGQALAQGFLQMDEYEQRVQAVFQTHTAGELKELLAGLPLDRIPRVVRRRRARPRLLLADLAHPRRSDRPRQPRPGHPAGREKCCQLDALEGIDMSKQQTGWAVVTGASSGLGAIFADQLAQRGLSLVLAGRDHARLTAVAQRVGQTAPDVDVQLVVGDLGTDAGIDALVADLDGRVIDVLVNNAGFGTYGRFSELDAG